MKLTALLAAHQFFVEPAAARTWAEGLGELDADAKAFFDLGSGEAPVRFRRRGGDAVIAVSGMLMPRDSWLTALCGGSSYAGIIAAVEQAEADPAVERIVLEVDSFGGSTSSMAQAAATIEKCTKRTIARVVGCAFSAGLYIALAADEVEAPTTAMVGSIGAIFEVRPGAEAGDGKIRFVSAVSPNKKADPTSAAGALVYQQVADDLGREFVDYVAHRTGLAADAIPGLFHDGGIVAARRAHEAGLITRLIDPRLAGAPDHSENDMDPEERIAQLEAENEELRKKLAEQGDDDETEAADGADDAKTEGAKPAGGAADDKTKASAADDKTKPSAAGEASAAAQRLAEATARFEQQAAKLGATAIFRAALAEGRVKPAEKEAFVGRLSEAVRGEDAVPDDWAGTVEFCKGSSKASAREWLSFFGTREPSSAVDLGIHTDGAEPGGEAEKVGFFDVRAALMSDDGISAEMAAELGFKGRRPSGGMSEGAADSWIIQHMPRLYPLLN